jgi:hypothetical protein
MSDAALVVVGSFLTRVEAELAHGALLAAEIESVISADDVGGQYASVAFGGRGVRLWVRPEDQRRAEDILNEASVPSEDLQTPPD